MLNELFQYVWSYLSIFILLKYNKTTNTVVYNMECISATYKKRKTNVQTVITDYNW